MELAIIVVSSVGCQQIGCPSQFQGIWNFSRCNSLKPAVLMALVSMPICMVMWGSLLVECRSSFLARWLLVFQINKALSTQQYLTLKRARRAAQRPNLRQKITMKVKPTDNSECEFCISSGLADRHRRVFQAWTSRTVEGTINIGS